MLFELSAAKKLESRSDLSLQFVIETKPWLRVFFGNLAGCFQRRPQVWLTSKPGDYWADAQIHRPPAWKSIGDSFLAHFLIAAATIGLTVLWLNQPHVIQDEPLSPGKIDNYQLSEYLPAVRQAPKSPDAPKRQAAQEADPGYAPQEIVSIQQDHQSARQTIVNPISPSLLSQDVPLPNIVVWTPTLAIAPMAASHPLQQLPLNSPAVVPPVEQPTQRNLNALQFPVQPQPVAPPQAAASRNLSALNLAVQPQTAVAPPQATTNRNLSALSLPAQSQAAVAPAQVVASRNLSALNLPTQQQTAVAPSQTVSNRNLARMNLPGQQQAIVPPSQNVAPRRLGDINFGSAAAAQPPVAPAEPVAQGASKSQAHEVGQLLVTNVAPVAPNGPMTVPEGNRQGEFALGPNGHSGASGKPQIAASAKNSSGGDGSQTAMASNVYVEPPPARVAPGVVVSAPVPPQPDVSTSSSRNVPAPERIDYQVFGDRKSYAIALSMPNLTSAAGSWIIRFAEANPNPDAPGEPVSAPIPVNKVDPAYPAALIRDHVEGVVILHAVIHSDGSVGDVRVLQGVDDTLDGNARDALQKWHFRPGTKNGAPVDLEAVIRVPFRAPKRLFGER